MAMLIWEIDMGIGQFAFYICSLFGKGITIMSVLKAGKIITVGISRLASLAGMIYLASPFAH